MKTNIKKKKYVPGGPVTALSTSNLKMPTFAKKLPNELAPGPTLSRKTGGGADFTEGISGLTEMGSEILDQLGQRAIDNADPRSNPAIAMKKANAMNTAGDLLKATGKGAAIGSAIPIIGTAVGAGFGLLTSGIGKIIGSKKQKKDLAEASSGWGSDNLSSYAGAMSHSSYAKGGTIKGAGTGKSDSINMKAKDGSFIVPSENADYGRQIGEEYLGWKPGEKASKKSGNVEIKASNTEVIFNPEEVRILKYHGIDLASLAPKANTAEGNASGGVVGDTKVKSGLNDSKGTKTVYVPLDDKQYHDYSFASDYMRNLDKSKNVEELDNTVIGNLGGKDLTMGEMQRLPKRFRDSKNMGFTYQGQLKRLGLPNNFDELNAKPSPGGIGGEDIVSDKNFIEKSGNKVGYIGTKTKEKDITKMAKGGEIGFGEIAGLAQAAGGAFGLATAKKAPDVGVSETLKNLSADVRKQAAYGLAPEQLNVLNNSIERSRRDTNRFITESGGSGQEVMSKLNTTLGTTIAGKEEVAFNDASEKAKKMSDVINVDSQIGNQEFDVKRMKKEDWYKNQEVFASLLSTGIENVIGARQFKEAQKTLRERDNRPVFNFNEE